MEERQTGGKADEWGFFNGMNVCSMLRRVRKQRMAGGKRGRTLALLGWRGAREELADFGNPSFISVKPSSAECRLADITELLTAAVFTPTVSWTDFTEVRFHRKAPPIQATGQLKRRSVQARRTPVQLF